MSVVTEPANRRATVDLLLHMVRTLEFLDANLGPDAGYRHGI